MNATTCLEKIDIIVGITKTQTDMAGKNFFPRFFPRFQNEKYILEVRERQKVAFEVVHFVKNTFEC